MDKYSNILGIPGKGFHKHIFGFALYDLLGTILIALLITRKHFIKVFVVLMLLAIFLHWLFGVKTVLNTFLGL